MCTVTYLPLKGNNFILTSSRDVPFARKKSIIPKKYTEGGVKLFYPRDGEAGGTWIGSSNKNRLICLLNGGFKNHKPEPYYKKSRGIIVKNLLKSDKIEFALENIDLKQVEPFTLVIVDWESELKLIEFVWDGKEKHNKFLSNKSHIWSSSTLYNTQMKKNREEWFQNWIKENEFKQKSILDFHHHAGIGDRKTDVLMKREKVGTVSITSVLKKGENMKWKYESII